MKQLKKPKPKRRKNSRKDKFWQKLKGTYQTPLGLNIDNLDVNHIKLQANVERLIAAVQQDLMWDDTDIETFDAIQSGYIDWSGEINKGFKKKKKKKISWWG
tara:strand:+ start:7114 stop:7419 length:306 start_codon:yes stop_codon:yes gene_type:complete